MYFLVLAGECLIQIVVAGLASSSVVVAIVVYVNVAEYRANTESSMADSTMNRFGETYRVSTW